MWGFFNQNVLFGYTDFSRKDPNAFYIINLILLLAKYHIHKCKFSSKEPHFLTFRKEIELYVNTICSSHNKKALKTVNVCKMFNVLV